MKTRTILLTISLSILISSAFCQEKNKERIDESILLEVHFLSWPIPLKTKHQIIIS